MTEPTTPAPGSNADHPDQHVVEVASARVDGVVTPSEQVEFVTDSRVSALADQFDSLRSLLAQNPEPPLGLREQHLAAALDALAPTPVASLEAARIRRAKRLAPVLTAAAAVAALVIVIGSVAGRSSNNEPVAAKNATEIAAADRAATDQAPQSEQTPVTAEVGTLDTQQLAPAAAIAADSVAEDAGTPADTASTDGTDQILAARSTTELRGIALAIVQRGETNRVPPLTNPCSAVNINGVPVAQVLWMDRPSLLFLVPSAENAVGALVVNPDTCDIEASASLTG